MADGSEIHIRRAGGAAELEVCAQVMSASEPWVTMGRGVAYNLKLLGDAQKECYVAVAKDGLAGHLLIDMNGPFAGYVQVLAVAPEWRGTGIGARLMEFAEARIFRESPNVFLCVAEFNPRAQEFYRKLGYARVGELKEYVIAGSSEFLMRKTIGPKGTFKTQPS